MSMLTIKTDYLQYLGERLFLFVKFLIHSDGFAMNNTTLQPVMIDWPSPYLVLHYL